MKKEDKYCFGEFSSVNVMEKSLYSGISQVIINCMFLISSILIKGYDFSFECFQLQLKS